MKTQKIALFHPWIKSRGGAEMVVLELLKKSRHDITLFTWVYDEKNTFEEFKKFDVKVIAPSFAKIAARFNIFRGIFLFLSFFIKIPLEKYDKFLISTSGVGEFITFKNKIRNKTFAYVHTPLREATKEILKWNLKNRYRNFIKKSFYLFSVLIYRFFERIAWKNLDVVVFNSELSKTRAVKRNLIKNKISKVINPPIQNYKTKKPIKRGKHFVYISRINPPKRQDLLIEAWKNFKSKNPGYKLILIGTVDNKIYFDKIKEMCFGEDSIEIKSNVSKNELENILGSSIAGVFLGFQEDFGMTPIEILSAGKPLIAVDEGGYIDLIEKHPLFYRVKEGCRDDMVKEIARKLKLVLKDKQKNKSKYKIEIRDFAREMDKVLEK